MTLKEIYHRLLPASIRYPIGHARRSAVDSWARWRTPGAPLPPRHMLRSVQMTPWIWEYLQVGCATAEAVRSALSSSGLGSLGDSPPRVLDFGCGLGRTLRFLLDTGWLLEGCDIDFQSIEWLRGALPDLAVEVNEINPPLPYPDHHFDGLYAVSVFTHFDRPEQDRWAAEVARVVRPGGLVLVTSMGPHALTGFEQVDIPAHREALSRNGFFFDPAQADSEEFNARGAFHTKEGLGSIFGPHFHLLRHESGGVDGFQDLTVFRARE
ncbi:MAG: class I SAM-dependent methyltransferase [Thermoanaerobaculia bacterium]|nr:class I SAM-dependent methyltransferase [Thermoanaerobaculia bacterium]